MSREQDLDRSEEATPHKREEARKRGQTARSTEAASLAVLAVATVGCYALLTPGLKDLARLLVVGLGAVPVAGADTSALQPLLAQGLRAALRALAPLLFAVVVAGVLMSLLQSGGLVFSSQPLKPDFNRLNPVQGFKKLFSVRLLYEAFKNSLKLVALAGVAALAVVALLPQALRLLGLPANALLLRWAAASGGLMAKLCAVLLLFVLVDLLFVRWDFGRNLRMSRREIEDEHKHREGDPRIKQRQREIRLQFLKSSRAVRKVPEAQVVVTNPTHVAVALRYAAWSDPGAAGHCQGCRPAGAADPQGGGACWRAHRAQPASGARALQGGAAGRVCARSLVSAGGTHPGVAAQPA